MKIDIYLEKNYTGNNFKCWFYIPYIKGLQTIFNLMGFLWCLLLFSCLFLRTFYAWNIIFRHTLIMEKNIISIQACLLHLNQFDLQMFQVTLLFWNLKLTWLDYKAHMEGWQPYLCISENCVSDKIAFLSINTNNVFKCIFRIDWYEVCLISRHQSECFGSSC